MTIYTRALNFVHRFTGREAAALRYQRDAHQAEAGRERRRRVAAERERDTFRTALQACSGVAAVHATVKIRGETIWKLQNRLTRWQRRYYQMRNARDRSLSQTAECNRQREQKASEHLWTLREMTDIAAQVKRELDAATALIERLTTARDEHTLAEALTWLRTRTPVRGATEQEGSRGGLAWMPGEASSDE